MKPRPSGPEWLDTQLSAPRVTLPSRAKTHGRIRGHGPPDDSGALEQTVLEVERRLDCADIQFCKPASEGKGLAPVIAEVLHRDLRFLVGANGLNLAAFLAFAGEEIEGLATCPAIVWQIA